MTALTIPDAIMQHFGFPGAVNDKVRAFFNALYTGSGSPEGVTTADTGSFYLDTTNGALYAKQSGSGNTGWIAGVAPGSGSGPYVPYVMAAPSGDTTGAVDSAAIAAVLARFPSGGVAIQFQPGHYYFNARVNCTVANVRVVGSGQGVTILDFTAAGLAGTQCLRFVGVTGCEVTDATVTGNTTSTHVISFDNCAGTGAGTGGRIERCTVSGGVTPIGGPNASTGLRIAFNTVSGGTGDGIATSGNNCDIEGNVVTGCGDGSITNQGGINVAGGLSTKVRDNRCESNGTHGIYAANCDYVEIRNNRCRLNGGNQATFGGRGITLGGTINQAVIDGNLCESNTENGMIVPAGVTDVTVTRNRCKNNNTGQYAGGHGIEIGGPGGIVEGNTCLGNNAGISCNGAKTIIVGNKCYSNVTGGAATFGVGIKLFDAADCTISANQCWSNTNSGIDVNGSGTFNGPVVNGNTCRSNGANGISVTNKATAGVYVGNRCASNTNTDISILDPNPIVRGSESGSDAGSIRVVTYSTSITPSRSTAEVFSVTVTDAVAFTINLPDTGTQYAGRIITWVINNNSGGAMGAITWNSNYHLAGAFTNPATGNTRSVTFYYNGSHYVELYRGAADAAP